MASVLTRMSVPNNVKSDVLKKYTARITIILMECCPQQSVNIKHIFTLLADRKEVYRKNAFIMLEK